VIKPVYSTTITVGPTGQYRKIQDAVAAASAGDTIQVAHGTYFEHVVIDKSLKIIGENPRTTIVDGTANGTVFTIKNTASTVTITGFTIRNAGDSANGIGSERNTATNDVHNFTNNIITTSQFGILFTNSSQNIVYNDTFINNAQCGISLNFGSKVNITGNTITQSPYGIKGSSSINNNITGNTITQTSYAIYLSSCTGNSIRRNVLSGKNSGIFSGSDSSFIDHNTITDGAYGIYLYNSVGASIYYNTLTNSSSSLRLYSTVVGKITNYNVNNNKMTAPNGWGIELTYANNNILTGNWIQTCSWGIYMTSSGSNTFYHNNFVKNAVQAYPGTGTGNKWNTTGEGNYWSDWNGKGNYTIDGFGGSPTYDIDYKPLKTTWSEHDIAVQSVTPSANQAVAGTIITITVKVRNNDNITASETFTVSAKYNSTIIGTQQVTSLAKGATQVLTFNWNTAGFAAANYTISASASTVTNELNTSNNNLSDGTVKITKAAYLGDINGDGKVDLADLKLLQQAFGSTPTSPNWNNGSADLNKDGVVNALDLEMLSQNFGKS
jgi:parallel beta-helix repeat protein